MVHSPPYPHSPAILYHHCVGQQRVHKYAETPAEIALGDASKAASRANAEAYRRELD